MAQLQVVTGHHWQGVYVMYPSVGHGHLWGRRACGGGMAVGSSSSAAVRWSQQEVAAVCPGHDWSGSALAVRLGHDDWSRGDSIIVVCR